MSILSTKDEGKWVTDQFGRELGIVTEVDAERQVAHVESAPNLTETMIQGLGFGDADADDFEVPSDWVVTVTDSELRVENEP